MIPYLKAQITGLPTPEVQRGIVREYLQMRILQSMQHAGAMISLAFHGGTALRLLYQLPRYSEDLDFALERQPEQYDFRHYLKVVRRDLTAETYNVEIKINEQRTVNSAFVRFQGLYHQLGISPHESEILAIKIEIDTNPPANAVLTTSFVQHHVPMHLQHHDQASLFSGKLHAILQRGFVKGRDWFDFYWYLNQSHWPSPNIEMLNNALAQSGWNHSIVTKDNWRSFVLEKLSSLIWSRVVDDVQRFIIEQNDLNEFKKETIESMLLNGEMGTHIVLES